jgi:hypothetical protein
VPLEYHAFYNAVGNDVDVMYSIYAENGAQYEVGIGQLAEGGGFLRDVVTASSSAGAKVDFDLGTHRITLAEFPAALRGGAEVASDAALPLPAGRVVTVTGTTEITSIVSTTHRAGAVVTLVFTDTVNVAHGNNIILAGGLDAGQDVDYTLTLVFDGSNWYETSRTVQ